MIAGLVIGAVTCYQLLFNEVLDRLAQFATLKAMGFSNGYLCRIVVGQALILSVIGFVLGLAVTVGADATSRSRTMLPIQADGTALAADIPAHRRACAYWPGWLRCDGSLPPIRRTLY